MPAKPKTIEFSYKPRAHFIPFHQRTHRWAAMVCHRRAGKTVACVNELVLRALYTKKHNARYAYIAPTFTQAKDIAWVYLKEAVKAFVVQIRESELRVTLPNNAWITLYGSDNQDRLRGLYSDGMVLDEYGDCRPSLWGEVLLPSLLDRDGWAAMIGTMKGKNHFYRALERARKSDDWYYMKLKASESGILTQEQLNAVRAESTPEEYEQEMECSATAAVRGTYYASTIEQLERLGQIKDKACSYDPNQPVNVACDIGFTDSSAFWFWQHRADGIAVIDYYENDSQPLPHYFDMLNKKTYEYDTVFLPHDAKAKTLQTGRSTVEQFLEAGFPCQITPRLAIQHGIDAARLILNHCWFDTTTCEDGVERLRAYKRKFDEINQCYADKPLHDQSSHGADAFRYLALVCRQKLPQTRDQVIETHIPREAVGLTLNQLYKDNENKQHKFEKLRI